MRGWIDKGRNSVLVSFILLALVGGWAIKSSADNGTQKLYVTQIQSCERGNTLRSESNERLSSHLADRDVLREFLAAARQARLSSGTPTDVAAAQSYGELIEILNDKVKFSKVPIIDCQKAIKKP